MTSPHELLLTHGDLTSETEERLLYINGEDLVMAAYRNRRRHPQRIILAWDVRTSSSGDILERCLDWVSAKLTIGDAHVNYWLEGNRYSMRTNLLRPRRSSALFAEINSKKVTSGDRLELLEVYPEHDPEKAFELLLDDTGTFVARIAAVVRNRARLHELVQLVVQTHANADFRANGELSTAALSDDPHRLGIGVALGMLKPLNIHY